MKATELIEQLRLSGTGSLKLIDLATVLNGSSDINPNAVNADKLYGLMTESGKFSSSTIDKACRIVNGQPDPVKPTAETMAPAHAALKEAESKKPEGKPK